VIAALKKAHHFGDTLIKLVISDGSHQITFGMQLKFIRTMFIAQKVHEFDGGLVLQQ
jgi:predicted metal-dependent RNase